MAVNGFFLDRMAFIRKSYLMQCFLKNLTWLLNKQLVDFC